MGDYKYGRDNLGREIYREDSSGNKTYNTGYIKKMIGSGSNTEIHNHYNSDSSGGYSTTRSPAEFAVGFILTGTGLIVFGLLLGAAMIWLGVKSNFTIFGWILAMIFPVVFIGCGIFMFTFVGGCIEDQKHEQRIIRNNSSKTSKKSNSKNCTTKKRPTRAWWK